jgi:hypothetical protein
MTTGTESTVGRTRLGPDVAVTAARLAEYYELLAAYLNKQIQAHAYAPASHRRLRPTRRVPARSPAGTDLPTGCGHGHRRVQARVPMHGDPQAGPGPFGGTAEASAGRCIVDQTRGAAIGVERRPAGGWPAVVAVTLGIFCLMTSELLPVGLLTPVRSELRVSDGTAGLMVAVPGLVAAVSAPLIAVYGAMGTAACC